jgi:hypothetical protein
MASQGEGSGVGAVAQRAGRFLILAGATFLVLLALQGALASPWSAAYRGLAGAALGRLGSTRVAFVPLEPPTEWQDTRILITSSRAPGLEAETRSGSRLDTYLPSALFLSLLLAGPGSAKGKIRSAAIGLGLIHIGAMGLIGLALVDQLADHPDLRPFAVPGALRAPLHSLVTTLRGHLQPMLLFTVLVWLLVTSPQFGVRDDSPTPSTPPRSPRRPE